jgi:hypothetical protein
MALLNLLLALSNACVLVDGGPRLWRAHCRASAVLLCAAAFASGLYHCLERRANVWTGVAHGLPGVWDHEWAEWCCLMLDEVLALCVALRCVPAVMNGALCSRGAVAWSVCAVVALSSELAVDPVAYTLGHSVWHVCAFGAAARLLAPRS